ncbi:hypothetical protein [Streptomyces bacillaris]|uniref:hypothetical protein n=1 Tax=Streptomyces bacillaris TaxID=68179 RepID=UPI00363C2F5E
MGLGPRAREPVDGAGDEVPVDEDVAVQDADQFGGAGPVDHADVHRPGLVEPAGVGGEHIRVAGIREQVAPAGPAVALHDDDAVAVAGVGLVGQRVEDGRQVTDPAGGVVGGAERDDHGGVHGVIAAVRLAGHRGQQLLGAGCLPGGPGRGGGAGPDEQPGERLGTGGGRAQRVDGVALPARARQQRGERRREGRGGGVVGGVAGEASGRRPDAVVVDRGERPHGGAVGVGRPVPVVGRGRAAHRVVDQDQAAGDRGGQGGGLGRAGGGHVRGSPGVSGDFR